MRQIESKLSNTHPTPLHQLSVWARLGGQSFGGGVATLSMIRRAVVEEQNWLSQEEFGRYWALVQLAPGVNLIGLTILIGQKVGGPLGVLVALVGLLLPSAAITVVITALYVHVQHLQIVTRALSGVIPATVGVGVVTGCQIAFPILKENLTQGAAIFVIGIALFVGSAVIFAVLHWPVAGIILLAGAIGAGTQFVRSSSSKTASS